MVNECTLSHNKIFGLSSYLLIGNLVLQVADLIFALSESLLGFTELCGDEIKLITDSLAASILASSGGLLQKNFQFGCGLLQFDDLLLEEVALFHDAVMSCLQRSQFNNHLVVVG